MNNLRENIISTIQSFSISGLNDSSVTSFLNDDRALTLVKDVIFTDYCVVLGGTTFEPEVFTPVNTKIRANTSIFLFAKSLTSQNNLYSTAQTLIDSLFGNKLGLSNVLINTPSLVDPVVYYNDKIVYAKINLYNVLYTNDTRIYTGCPPTLVFSSFSHTDDGFSLTHSIIGSYVSAGVTSITWSVTFDINSSFPPGVGTQSGSCTYDATSWYLTPGDAYESQNNSNFVYIVTITDGNGRQTSITFTIV